MPPILQPPVQPLLDAFLRRLFGLRILAKGSTVIPPNSVGFLVASGVRAPGEVLKAWTFVSDPAGPLEYAEGFGPLVVQYRFNHTGAPDAWAFVADNADLLLPATLDWAIVGLSP